MKYYIVEETTDQKIVGSDFVQVHDFIKGYDPKAPNALFSMYKYRNSFPEYIPDLDGLKVSGSSKLTDIVSNSFNPWFHIISPRTKALFEKYNLCSHHFYPVGLYRRKIKYDYFLLSILPDHMDYVDYAKTGFIIHDLTKGKDHELIDINSKSAFYEANNALEKEKGTSWCIHGTQIVMSKAFDSDLDFFEVGMIDSNLYISERMKLAIEAEGITGWDFIPATNLIVPEK